MPAIRIPAVAAAAAAALVAAVAAADAGGAPPPAAARPPPSLPAAAAAAVVGVRQSSGGDGSADGSQWWRVSSSPPPGWRAPDSIPIRQPLLPTPPPLLLPSPPPRRSVPLSSRAPSPTRLPTPTPTPALTPEAAGEVATPEESDTATPEESDTATPEESDTATPEESDTESPSAAPPRSTPSPTASSLATPSPTTRPSTTPRPRPVRTRRASSPSPSPTLPSPSLLPTDAPSPSPVPSTAPATSSPSASPALDAVATSSPTATPTRTSTPTPTPTSSPGGDLATWRIGDGLRKCTSANSRVRKEVRDLTDAERLALTTAMRTLMDRPDESVDDLVAIHRLHARAVHGGPIFLPWHRLFLLDFEDALRVVDPSVVLPYWQWTVDWEDPAMSRVWSADLLGGATSGGCIADGLFADIRTTFPAPRCVRRGFNSDTPRGMGRIRFEEPSVLAELVTGSSNYATFVRALEFAHGAPHAAIGGALLRSDRGDMFSLFTSAADPSFYLHHAFVDKLWADRQATPGKSATEYGGAFRGRRVSSTDTLAPFNATVADAMALPCVSYAPMRARPAARGRSARARADAGAKAETRRAAPLTWAQAVALVEATNGDKVWAMELFARANGVPEAILQAQKAALKKVEVVATVKGTTAAACGDVYV